MPRPASDHPELVEGRPHLPIVLSLSKGCIIAFQTLGLNLVDIFTTIADHLA